MPVAYKALMAVDAKDARTTVPAVARRSSAEHATPTGLDGRARVVIEAIRPAVPDGPFAVKRVVGERVDVHADIFADGHDMIAAVVRHRLSGSTEWFEARMQHTVNDAWEAAFEVRTEGEHEFHIQAWVDHFATWQRDLGRRAEARQDLSVEFIIGADLIESRAGGHPAHQQELRGFAQRLRNPAQTDRMELAVDPRLTQLMFEADPRHFSTQAGLDSRIWVDRQRARFSAWYELFPRSTGAGENVHGTLRDVISRLDAIASMGFNVLYLPPIHPIGVQFRKGRNNSLTAEPGDVGSPWAIGARQGGHDSVHPDLGTPEDLRALVAAAAERGIEIALDLALQCSPDHPYVTQHPEWFRHRPDGSIQYAENPPKKYQDIYPFEFECPGWKDLWNEILRVVLFWVGHGVRIFRVDNPHTKPFGLWEWLIAQVKKHDPGVLFLSEAFTRPKVMARLAKIGFTQSYTYFTWRGGPGDLREYFTQLTTTPMIDFFRPNAWPNTPDILPEHLQHAGRPAFIVRAVLASTLCASWGVYGPAYELMERLPMKPGSEEYLNSEKYQIRAWDTARPDSLAPLLSSLNAFRRDNPALQHDRTLHFHQCDNPAVVAYSKTSGDNAIVVIANTDYYTMQWSKVHLDLSRLGLTDGEVYQMHDLITGARYRWQGRTNVVGLDPATCPAHVFRVRRLRGTEASFEHFT